jgi:hypothetical protein
MNVQNLCFGSNSCKESLFVLETKTPNTEWTNTDNGNIKNVLFYVSWFIANLISIMVMWTLLFIAFKSNKFTEKISSTVDTITKQWIKTIPFIPTTKWNQSISSTLKIANTINQIPWQISAKQTNKAIDSSKKENNEKDKKNK